jgi:ribosomal protein S18 acetylase RimI-like enzyme
MRDHLSFKPARDVAPEAIVAFWLANDISISRTDTPDALREAVHANPELFLVAIDEDDAIAGTVWGNFDGRRGFVVHLAVRRDLRGRGLGRELMDRVEARFRAMGVFRIHLFVERTNLDVIDYYRERGFEIRDDLVLMSKTFD